MEKRKVIKLSHMIVFGCIATMVSLTHCVSFHVKQSEVDSRFQNSDLSPEYHHYEALNRNIHWVSLGEKNKPMVLFVHGSPGHWTNYLDYFFNDKLQEKTYIAAVDRPGFGLSGRGHFEPSLQTQATLLRPILEQHQDQPVILVGHSLGGPLIARMAMDYPHLIDALIFVAPSIDPDLEKVTWYQKVANWKIISWMVPKDLTTANREILPLKGELEAMVPKWKQIKIPVTVIQGDKDKLVPPGNADFAKKMLINAQTEMVRIKDLNHFVPWSHPHLIYNAIDHHLKLLEKQ